MQTAPVKPDPIRLAAAAILGLTLYRLALIPFSSLELYVDEAQYWLWGQELAAGAYSKPPLVGWLIRLANEITGSNAPWVARLPWPLVHGAAALAVLALARRLAPALIAAPVAALAGVSYATLPAVSTGSLLISTDSPMMLALALSLWLWHRQAQGAGRVGAVLLGLAIAAGFWSKYAMAFPLVGMAVTLALFPGWRLRWCDALIVAATALLAFAPNIAWNMAHDMATVRHTAENADYQGVSLHLDKGLRFLAEQFAVAGPLVFAALLLAFAKAPAALRPLIPLAAAPLLICTAQAFNAGANANWAVGAYVPGVTLAAALLARRRWAWVASLGISGVLALALPLLAVFGGQIRLPNGQPLLARYQGFAAPIRAALKQTPHGGQPALVVASDRDVLAQLFYQNGGKQNEDRALIRALPPKNRPADSHYELIYPLTTEPGPALFIGRNLPGCASNPQVLTGTVQTATLSDACLNSLR
ncbi:MAG: glycosyltransferase family 39 protein [Paracoccus sp. (in: a-proteobacteria)]|uniref:ArnT family glycosyltransferase n=1 Tax=Paracoccus sp. TaxID=267 RepID=UPI0026E0416D|nr:glycosyltransferase family 39 protein [Paracoccus sp. (in: a-proteobacteria)]MDO5621716.1 glycosyltransferase family 39 protein [Paracoccus sp. (in: a-proteobacteria)]